MNGWRPNFVELGIVGLILGFLALGVWAYWDQLPHPQGDAPMLKELLHDNVLVLRDSAEAQSPGGIFLPEAALDAPPVGEVIAVGPGRVSDNGTMIKTRVKVGDRVLFSPFAGTIISLEKHAFILLQELDVVAILDPEEEPEEEEELPDDS